MALYKNSLMMFTGKENILCPYEVVKLITELTVNGFIYTCKCKTFVGSLNGINYNIILAEGRKKDYAFVQLVFIH